MLVRDRCVSHLPAALALAALTLVHARTGVGADALIAVPGLLLLIPLVAGRYLGEGRLARLARRPPRPAARRAAAVAAPRRPRRRLMPRGGRLIAVALARRGPPLSAVAR
jgi:hypothetical protein